MLSRVGMAATRLIVTTSGATIPTMKKRPFPFPLMALVASKSRSMTTTRTICGLANLNTALLKRQQEPLDPIRWRSTVQFVTSSRFMLSYYLSGKSTTTTMMTKSMTTAPSLLSLCCGRRNSSSSSSSRRSIATTTTKTTTATSTMTLSDGSTVNDMTRAAPITSRDGVVGQPIDFDIAARIDGNESQIVTVTLEPGQVLRAESGALLYMTTGIEMNTTTGGGLSAGFQRMLTGQNFFISDYTYQGSPGTTGQVALGTDFPSKILRINLAEYPNNKMICQKGALLCASHTIDIQMEFTKRFATGFFGGEGFILQGLTGHGEAFLKAGGTLIRRDLSPGEILRISSGCLVAFSSTVEYDVQMVQGFANVFAGGEGLFITTLTGPGVVWLQGQPAQRMISEIARRVPAGGGLGLAIPVGGGGGGSGGVEGNGGDGTSSNSVA